MCRGSKEKKHCRDLSREHRRQPHVSPVVGAVDSVYQLVRSSHVAAHVIQDVDAVRKGCDVCARMEVEEHRLNKRGAVMAAGSEVNQEPRPEAN